MRWKVKILLKVCCLGWLAPSDSCRDVAQPDRRETLNREVQHVSQGKPQAPQTCRPRSQASEEAAATQLRAAEARQSPQEPCTGESRGTSGFCLQNVKEDPGFHNLSGHLRESSQISQPRSPGHPTWHSRLHLETPACSHFLYASDCVIPFCSLVTSGQGLSSSQQNF